MGLNARNPLKLPKGARICPRCFDNSLERGLKWHKIMWAQRAMCSIFFNVPDDTRKQC
jgi:hypothetical protein